jgi:alkylation response protein AidB-like acyl-CoA dehydrogenase
VALGTAQGALDDILAMADDKVPLFASTPLAANRLFQHHLALADTELRAAQGLARDCAGELWSVAAAGDRPAGELVARARAAAAWCTATAVRVGESAYRFGGGSSVLETHPLQRRLRDLQVIAQHFLVRSDTLATAGAARLGQPTDVLVF